MQFWKVGTLGLLWFGVVSLGLSVPVQAREIEKKSGREEMGARSVRQAPCLSGLCQVKQQPQGKWWREEAGSNPSCPWAYNSNPAGLLRLCIFVIVFLLETW